MFQAGKISERQQRKVGPLLQLLLFALSLLLFIPSLSQAQSPATPSFEDPKLPEELSLLAFQNADKVFPGLRIFAEFDRYKVAWGTEVTLLIRVFIPKGWHVYSVRKQDKDGPLPTRVEASSKIHRRLGELRETPPLQQWDDALEMHVNVHREQFLLEQNYLIVEDVPESIQDLNGFLIFQSCDNRVCVPVRQQAFSAPLEIVR